MAAEGVPVVAVVGRPNVGKSSLVNRILGAREAIVDETPGVTRDRRGFLAQWRGRDFELLDTGGIEPASTGLDAQVVEQARVAIDIADLVVLVVDATTGILSDDHQVAELLRRAGKPAIIAVNKIDDPMQAAPAAEFHRLGLGDPAAVSALHGTGSGDLLDRIVAELPEVVPRSDQAWAATAIVGRPNVGKSSILNALVGQVRAIVDSAPGTTRDPVDSLVELDDGRIFRLVDTAGMRRQVKIDDPVEYFGLLRSRGTLDRADAAILVVDSSEGVTGHDQRIAQEVVERGRACVIALNKWDLVRTEGPDRARFEQDLKDKLRFVPWAPVARTSAITGRGLDRLVPLLDEAIASHRRRVPTAEVNRIIRDAQDRRPPPRRGGRSVRILYAVQTQVSPPTIVLFCTRPLDDSYLRYVENALRRAEGFFGSPLRIHARVRTRDPAPAGQ